MAKLIKLHGVDGEELIINTSHLAGVKSIDDKVFDEDRADILAKDSEIKSLINVTLGIQTTSMIIRDTVDEVIALVNG